jgi:hypothetical protein
MLKINNMKVPSGTLKSLLKFPSLRLSDSDIPPAQCLNTTIIQDWDYDSFRPDNFDKPAPIEHPTEGQNWRRIWMVDLYKRDIEIDLWFDDENPVHLPANLDPTIDCGDNVATCLDLSFAYGFLLIPPGKHTFKAKIHERKWSKASASSCLNDVGDDLELFDWGGEEEKRVAWLVEECHS